MERVGDAEERVEVELDQAPDALGLEKVVVKSSVRQRNRRPSTLVLESIEGKRRDRREISTHSADNANVPNKIRFLTSSPNPSVLVRAYNASLDSPSCASGSSARYPNLTPSYRARFELASADART